MSHRSCLGSALLSLCVFGAAACGGEPQPVPEIDRHVDALDSDATCGGEPVPDLPRGYVDDVTFGDVQIVHASEGEQTFERSLLSGELTPLFELDRWDEPLVLDERELFVVSRAGVHRFDRVTRELSLFVPNPEPGEESGFPTRFARVSMALSDTQLVSLITDQDAFDVESNNSTSYVLEVIERSSGARRLLRIEQALASGRLIAHQGRFFASIGVNLPSDGTLPAVEATIYSYDLEAGTAEPLHWEPSPSGGLASFWQDSVLLFARGESTHSNLLRAPLSGGAAEIVATGLEYPEAIVIGDEVFLPQHDGTRTGGLTAFDLRDGSSRAIGGCHPLLFHGSDSYLYAYFRSNDILRLAP